MIYKAPAAVAPAASSSSSSALPLGVEVAPPPPLPAEDDADNTSSRRSSLAPREARAEPWGPWTLARLFTHTDGGQVHGGWMATCREHQNEGDVQGRACRKSLWMGTKGAIMRSDECKLSIKLWLLAGSTVAQSPRARSEHLKINPRHLELIPADEVGTMVGRIRR